MRSSAVVSSSSPFTLWTHYCAGCHALTVFGKACHEGGEDLKPLLAEDGQAVAPRSRRIVLCPKLIDKHPLEGFMIDHLDMRINKTHEHAIIEMLRVLIDQNLSGVE